MSKMRSIDRDSNMELMRIVCMFFILVHHFIIHVFYPNLSIRDGDLNLYRAVCILMNGFTYVGVNCFILISGYYGIKFKVRSLFNLYCICAFYALLLQAMNWGVCGLPFDRNAVYSVILPFTHTQWWFIKCYVALFLLSPLLNKAIENLDDKEFGWVLLLMAVVNVYFGYYWHQHNVDGYNLEQFVFVYLIGGFLRKVPFERLSKNRALLLYVLCAMLWSGITILSVKRRIPHWISFHYNNPLVLLASIGFFVYFTKLDFHKGWINAVASSVLAAYLIQDVQGGVVYSLADRFRNDVMALVGSEMWSISAIVAFVILGSIVVLATAIAIDRFRMLLMIPVWKIYNVFSRKFMRVFR